MRENLERGGAFHLRQGRPPHGWTTASPLAVPPVAGRPL